MKTSRQRLLSYLEKKQVASARDISSALKMTPANARHHLSILIQQGSVEIAGKRVGSGRGRPQNLYKVVKRETNINLKALIEALFQELYIAKSEQSQYKEQILQAIANRLTDGDPPGLLNPTQRLNRAVTQLNQINYDARWEAHSESPHVIFNNCPYHDIVEDIPEICMIDKYVLENLSGISVVQIAKLELSPLGLKRCVFSLGDTLIK